MPASIYLPVTIFSVHEGIHEIEALSWPYLHLNEYVILYLPMLLVSDHLHPV